MGRDPVSHPLRQFVQEPLVLREPILTENGNSYHGLLEVFKAKGIDPEAKLIALLFS